MEDRAALFTVRNVLPKIPGGLAMEVAVMVVVPTDLATAKPVMESIVATDVDNELQPA